jgi:hypothetical protein
LAEGTVTAAGVAIGSHLLSERQPFDAGAELIHNADRLVPRGKGKAGKEFAIVDV